MTSWRRVPRDDASTPTRARLAASYLAEDGVLAHPTETVYGLGGGTPPADERIRRLKGRRREEPFLRIAPSVAGLRASHPELEWTRSAERLAEAFWPGPLTLVLEDGTKTGLGVRVEAHPDTRAVLEAWGRTMSSTSLNRSGEPAASTASEARRALDALGSADGGPVWWLDAGDLPGGPPSTLLSLRGGVPRLLRAGAIGVQRIESVLREELEHG